MTQQAFLPSPKTTLVVILGTSDYPYAPDIESVTEFANSARDFKQYVLTTFGIPKENVHDLFNSPLSPADMETNIAEFFKQRTAKLAWDGITVRDALIYFVGHGSFTEGNRYGLLVRYTRIPGPPSSRLLMGSLASTIKESTRHIRRILVLDCCFAGAAVQYQSPDAEFVIRQTIGAFAVLDRGQGFPTKGTTLLCSSSKDRASIIM